jgi:hypothetical protein
VVQRQTAPAAAIPPRPSTNCPIRLVTLTLLLSGRICGEYPAHMYRRVAAHPVGSVPPTPSPASCMLRATSSATCVFNPTSFCPGALTTPLCQVRLSRFACTCTLLRDHQGHAAAPGSLAMKPRSGALVRPLPTGSARPLHLQLHWSHHRRGFYLPRLVRPPPWPTTLWMFCCVGGLRYIFRNDDPPVGPTLHLGCRKLYFTMPWLLCFLTIFPYLT